MPKRLVDQVSCGGGLQWLVAVHPSCILATESVTSTLTVSPVLALKFTRTAAVVGRTTYYASPVCPPNFSPRGETKCHSTDGVWRDQNSLACFSLECYQNHNGKHYYAGYKNVTKSGRPCWPWKDQGPFGNNMRGFDYTFDYFDINKAKNYCRMFLKEEGYDIPWCYNANYDSETDPLRFEKCLIPQCYDTY
ncbi:hepatocyte growth factor [Elysia marginata]|uniref:Hepatocyte growth factor n=1 Tax=Elysia marginata TaxID=1093978 RepID=A0AAV4HUH5_9GAST|nr:hepatocyte growth factor [Elysia marginata]